MIRLPKETDVKRLTTASVLLAFSFAGTSSAMAPLHSTVARRSARGCERTFTVAMARRAARAVFAGSRTPRKRGLLVLARIERCQRNPQARSFVARLYRREEARRAQRVRAAQDASLPQAQASWYDDSSGACASPAGCSPYGVANKTLAFGTRVLICYPAGSAHCVETVVDDRGPFVAGREWDLDQNVAGALGFSGVQTVSYRIG